MMVIRMYKNQPVVFEEWKNLSELGIGIRDCYSISNFGHVYSSIIGRFLAPAISQGYQTVQLATIFGYRKTFYIHRLVALAFVENPDPFLKIEVNHIDKNRGNPMFYNLEWLTKEENIHHELYSNIESPVFNSTGNEWGGYISYGSSNGMSKIDEEQAHMICKYLENGLSINEIYSIMSITYPNITKNIIKLIKHRKRWKQISNQYTF